MPKTTRIKMEFYRALDMTPITWAFDVLMYPGDEFSMQMNMGERWLRHYTEANGEMTFQWSSECFVNWYFAPAGK